MNHDTGSTLTAIDAQIAWVIRHQGINSWLKQALEAACGGDPTVAANEAEVLAVLLRARADAWVETQLKTSTR